MVPQLPEGLSANTEKVHGHTGGVHFQGPPQDCMP